MAATEILDRILHRLDSPKWLYQGLVDQFPPHTKTLSMLMRKLKRVEEVIGGIGSDEAELAGEWRERVAILWVKYADLSIASMYSNANSRDDECDRDDNAKSPSPAESAHSFSSSMSSQNAKKSPALAEPILKQIIPSSYPVYKPPPRNITPAAEEENFPLDNNERQLSKTALRAKMQDSFFDLQIDSFMDVDGLAAMIRMISRACKLLMPYDRDSRLKWDIFGNAFDKLPFELQTKYRDEFGMLKSLPNLFHWLSFQISQIYVSAHKLADLAQDGDSGVSLNSGSNELDSNKTLCFKCFQFGHAKIRCPNNKLFISKDDTVDGRPSRQTTRPSHLNDYNCN